MTKRELVKNTIYRRDTGGKAPYAFDMTSRVVNRAAAHYGIKPGELSAFMGDCLLPFGLGSARGFAAEDLGEGRYRDEFGVVWDKGDKVRDVGDWGGMLSHPLSNPVIDGFEYPNPRAPGRFDHIREAEITASGRYPMMYLNGLLDQAWHIRGFEPFMMDLACEETFASALLDKALEFIIGVVESTPSFIEGIRFGEDWGQQCGLFMGGPMWRKFLKPRLREMYASAHKRGFDVHIHTCGDIMELFPDIIELGVQVVHPIQPEAMDVARVKREYGKDLTLYGGLGSQSTIPLGSVADVLDEARARLELLGKDGGYIFGPAGAIPTEAPTENVVALIDFAMDLQ